MLLSAVIPLLLGRLSFEVRRAKISKYSRDAVCFHQIGSFPPDGLPKPYDNKQTSSK